MAKFDFLSVWRKMGETGIVPVFYHADADVARSVVGACYAGGIRAFEFTNRGDGAHEVFAALVRYVRSECPDMALGVGTVTDAATAALYMQLGADFVVGPTFNADVARTCHRRSLPYVPGCGTVTEVSDAQAAGCPVCKLFPGDVLTPRFVKDLLAPLPWWHGFQAVPGICPVRRGLGRRGHPLQRGPGYCPPRPRIARRPVALSFRLYNYFAFPLKAGPGDRVKGPGPMRQERRNRPGHPRSNQVGDSPQLAPYRLDDISDFSFAVNRKTPQRLTIKRCGVSYVVPPVVPPGIEPGTQGFSVLCSTN